MAVLQVCSLEKPHAQAQGHARRSEGEPLCNSALKAKQAEVVANAFCYSVEREKYGLSIFVVWNDKRFSASNYLHTNIKALDSLFAA